MKTTLLLVAATLMAACKPPPASVKETSDPANSIEIKEVSNGKQIRISDAKSDITISYGADKKTIESIGIKRVDKDGKTHLIGIDENGSVISKIKE